MGSQRGSDRPESSSSRSQDIRLVQGAPPNAAAVPKMACDRLFSPDPTNLKPISNSNLSPFSILFGVRARGGDTSQLLGGGQTKYEGALEARVWGCVPARGRGESGCSASTGYSSSTQPIPSPQTTQGGLGGGLRAPAAGACRRRATHHRLHREKVVRPRCAVRLAGSTHQAGPPGQWHVAALARRHCPTL